MNEVFAENFYSILPSIIKGSVVDVSNIQDWDPWTLGIISLLLVERHAVEGRNIILPRNESAMQYLRQMDFSFLLKELGYLDTALKLTAQNVPENEHLLSITHSRRQDEFSARENRFQRTLQNFGLHNEDVQRALTILLEAGNNVFDHNVGSWVTDFSGSIIFAQNYPQEKRLVLVVGDAGIGFAGSLKLAFPELQTDVEAIKKGLEGNTGRVDEDRGNGLQLIQNWTINKFNGSVIVQSNAGLVEVSARGIHERKVFPIVGTLVQVVLHYK